MIKTINKDEIFSQIKNGYAIFWLRESIEFARIRDFKFEFYDRDMPKLDEILTARIFDENKELFINNQSRDLLARLRDDNGLKEDEDYIQSEFYLMGSKFEKLENGFCKLSSKSGSEFIIPLENQDFKLVAVTRRDYISTSKDTNQAFLKDFRLVSMKGVKKWVTINHNL